MAESIGIDAATFKYFKDYYGDTFSITAGGSTWQINNPNALTVEGNSIYFSGSISVTGYNYDQRISIEDLTANKQLMYREYPHGYNVGNNTRDALPVITLTKGNLYRAIFRTSSTNVTCVFFVFEGEKIAPTLNITGNPITWTNSNVILSCTCTDDSGIKSITVNNSEISGGTYIVSNNGSYVFKAIG